MQQVDLRGIDYIGAEIVQELVQKNKETYESSSVRCEHLNLLEDELPAVDVIFCRDCLVHLSFKDIARALQNVCRSQSKYLLITTFTECSKNVDIATGQWRPINLQMPPFNLPAPIRVISEQCSEGEGDYQDKVLALWAVEEIFKNPWCSSLTVNRRPNHNEYNKTSGLISRAITVSLPRVPGCGSH